MRVILQQLFDGDICPAEQFYPKTKEYKAMRKKHCIHCENFIKKLEALKPSLSKEFIQIMDEQLDIVSFEFSDMFIEGFRLGARIVIEIYEGDSSGEQ